MISFVFGTLVCGAVIMLLVTIVFGTLYLLGELLMGIIAAIYSFFDPD